MTSKLVRKDKSSRRLSLLFCHAVSAATLRIWRLVVAIKHRRELAHLANLDDRMLADMGLTRRDLHDVQSEPLSRDPTSMLARRAADGEPRPPG